MLGGKKSTGLVSRVSRKKVKCVMRFVLAQSQEGVHLSCQYVSRHRYTVSLDFILASDIQ